MVRLRLPEYPFPDDLKEVLKMLDNNNSNNDVKMSQKAQFYMKILNEWQKAKRIEPTESHYVQVLKFALYLEEYQCKKDMRKYDLRNKMIIKTDSDIFRINTEQWDDEEKPMIRTSDWIDVVDIREKKSYALCIVNVTEKFIDATSELFLERYSTKKLYDIRLRYQNYTDRCNHFALWLAHQRNVISYLFPNNFISLTATTTTTLTPNNIFYNPSIKTNNEQIQAVSSILYKSSYPLPYILYGPPGTGKTATIVEAICQIVVQNSTNRVLVCTPSNSASDEVTKRLLNYIDPEDLYRMYSGSKEPSTIDKKILSCCNCVNGKINTFTKIEDVSRKQIVITTLCNCIKLILIGLGAKYFSHVIIDEAGQSKEPDILIPVSLVSENGKIHSQIVLAGDPKQLGPVVMSKLAEIVLGRSILERFMSYRIYQKYSNGRYNSKFITKLRINYRSHPKIIHISNELFYDRELKPRLTTEGEERFPVIFYGTRAGKEEKVPNSTSSCNRKEIEMVLRKIKELLQNNIDHGLGEVRQEDIGIVTPFKLQSKELKKGLARRNLKNIDVGTVELFQGQEKRIIIISAVRTRIFPNGEFQHIGSLSNPKRFNVAVTRAKDMLIVIGDPNALQIDISWRFLLQYCIANKSSHDVRPHLRPLKSNNIASETSEIALSSDIFTWRKFKIFMLDGSDSNTDIIETMNVILYPTPAPRRPPPITRPPPRPTLPVPRPVQYTPPRWEPIIVRKEKKTSRCAIL